MDMNWDFGRARFRVFVSEVAQETPSSGDLFLATFGKPERMMACECERSNETTLNQVFFLVSDKGIGERMEQKESRVRQLAESEISRCSNSGIDILECLKSRSKLGRTPIWPPI